MANTTKSQPGRDLCQNDALARSLKYDFAAELVAGTWRVIRKKDRFEFLARDETNRFQDESGTMTPLGTMLHPQGMNLLLPIMRIFNHENLINLIDWIQVQRGQTTNYSGRSRHYIIWDFCNAGTLENLFFADQVLLDSELATDQRLREEASANKDHEMSADGLQPSGFLPEAFCWHVTVSILKALAWLHDGLRDEWCYVTNNWVIKRADIDWHTILHRNINPANIFFCHPQTRFETYGLCKLGNFSDAFVSGVFNGVLNDVVPPALSQKVLAPRKGVEPFMKILRKQDASLLEETHASKCEQPYTITSEYHALADVIVAMMVRPEVDSEGNDHWQRLSALQSKNVDKWLRLIAQTPYTLVLKEFVTELISKGEAVKSNCKGTAPISREVEMTFCLYRKARDLYDKFRTVEDEGKDVVTADHVQAMQGRRDRNTVVKHEEEERRKTELLNYFATSNRFNNDVAPESSLDRLLAEINEVCDDIDNAYHDSQFQPKLLF